MILKNIFISAVVIFITLFFICGQLFADSKNTGYCDIGDFSVLKENICQKCEIDIGEDVLYEGLYYGKFRYASSGTSKEIEQRILLRLCKECAKGYDFIDKVLIFSEIDNAYKPMNSFNRSDLSKCFSCGVELGINPCFVIDAREEKMVNNEVEIVDSIATLQLCENCKRKYDLSRIKIGVL